MQSIVWKGIIMSKSGNSTIALAVFLLGVFCKPVLADSAPPLSDIQPGVLVPHVEFPYVPVLALPDLSFLDDTGREIKANLTANQPFESGLDVLGATCVAGQYQYQSKSPSVFEATNGPQSYTCLLYTSPSPRDRTRSRMPSSA